MTVEILPDDASPSNDAGGSGIVRSRPKGSLAERAREAMSKLRDGHEAAQAASDTDDAPEPAAPRVKRAERGTNGRFQPVEDEGAPPPAPVVDQDDITTRPDVPKPRIAKLERLEARAAEERKRRSADQTLRDVQRQQQELARQQQEFHTQRSQFEDALNRGDPAVLKALIDRAGPDAISEYIMSEADPARKAARAAQQQQRQAPPAPSDERVARLEQQLQQFIGARAQQDGEAKFRARIEQVADHPEAGAPLTARLLKADPKMLFKKARSAFLELQAEQKPFDDDDMIMKIEEELALFATLHSSTQQARSQEPDDDRRTPPPQRRSPADAPARASVARTQRSLNDTPAVRLAKRMRAAQQVIASGNRR